MNNRSYKGAFVSTASFSKIPNIHAIKLAVRTVLCSVCFVSLQFEGKRPWNFEFELQRNNQTLRRLTTYTTVILQALLDKVVDISLYFTTLLRNYQRLFTSLHKFLQARLTEFQGQLWAVVHIARDRTRCPEMPQKNYITFLVLFGSLSCFFPASFSTHFGLFTLD